MSKEKMVRDLDTPLSHGEFFSMSTRVSDILELTDEELIADLKMRIPPIETPDVALGDRQYLQENIPTYYIAAYLTSLQLRGPSFRDESQSNIIFDNDGWALNLIALCSSYKEKKGKKNQSDFSKIIEVSESRLGIQVISRKFVSYLNS